MQTLTRLPIPGLATVGGICRVTGKPFKTVVDFNTVQRWIMAGKPRPYKEHLPYSDDVVRFIAMGISPTGWRILNE